MSREIAYMKMQLSNDARSGAGSMVPGEGDKTGTYAASNNMIPIYKMDFEVYAPDVNTIQATVPKPVDQKPMVIRKLGGNASPGLFQAHVSKKGVWNVEFHITKASGTDAEVVALKLVGTNGIITRFRMLTEITKGISQEGRYHEHLVQYEEIELVCTAWTIENFKILKDDKTTAGEYDFREPNKGKAK
jgi:type VI protein secretion system component Hcp